MITEDEKALTRECLAHALSIGAQKVRITLTKSTEDQISTLDGEIDKVTRCADRTMNIALFVDGRYGAFSINKLEEATLKDFISKAAGTVRMLAPDEFRTLPDPDHCCKSAVTGRELDSYDPEYCCVSPDDRRRRAIEASVFNSCPALPGNARLISEEGEYSDSEYDVFVIDSQGLECRHTETSFDYGVEVTIEDTNGNKYSDYWWTSSSKLRDFDASACNMTAVRRACAQIGAGPARSGRYNMVVASNVASRLVSPLLNALNAYSLQQGNSFLVGSIGRQIFSEKMTLVDDPWRKGESGSKLFDSEGVATHEAPIIAGGIVMRFFVNTYMAGKLGIDPTYEDAIRPRLCAYPGAGGGVAQPEGQTLRRGALRPPLHGGGRGEARAALPHRGIRGEGADRGRRLCALYRRGAPAGLGLRLSGRD